MPEILLFEELQPVQAEAPIIQYLNTAVQVHYYGHPTIQVRHLRIWMYSRHYRLIQITMFMHPVIVWVLVQIMTWQLLS